MKKVVKDIVERHLLLSIISAFVVNFLIEILSRRSIYLGIHHLLCNPLVFVLNMILLTFFFYITCLFKRKCFAMLFVAVIWLGMGITNCVVLGFRTTPLGAIDFKIIKCAVDIIPVYLNTFEIILIAVAIVAVIAFLVYSFIKLPKSKPKYKKNILSSIIVTLLTILIVMFSQNMNIVSTRFASLVDAYSDYGFVYCFMCTLIDKGIDRPSDYSKDAINIILSEIDESNDKNNSVKNDKEDDINLPDNINNSEISDEDKDDISVATNEHPNIIFLQLESFFDVNNLKNVTYSEDPIPVFRHLKDVCSSGYLTVPTVGAGTANTEFEVLTGMSLQFFGPGEYPYTTILQSSTCETINYNLKELGYKAQAIHNHNGAFYGRNDVYKQLGFDNFTSIEYMKNIERNPLGWCKDNILKDQILKALDSTEQRDFVFTISVQGHGRYPLEVIDETQKITAEGVDESIKIGFEYFINQLKDMDDFIGSLISTLENYDEPVVLVMYGDHLPAFDIKDEQLKNNSIFQTEYIVWNNIGWQEEDMDIHSYQLSSKILSRLGIDNGILTRFHKMNSENSDYLDELEMLEHDMLYGDKLIYNGIMPYQPTDLHMGIDEIEITSIKKIGDEIYVIGKNFTDFSEVFINNKKRAAKYKDDTTIILDNVTLSDGDILTVNQISDDWEELSRTEEFIYMENSK